SCSSRRGRLPGEIGDGAFGELQPGPDVHVDDDPDDLEDFVGGEVLGEGVVPGTEVAGGGGICDAGDGLGIGKRCAGRVAVEVGLPPGGQGVDYWSGDIGVACCLVVEVQTVDAVVDLGYAQPQELGQVPV